MKNGKFAARRSSGTKKVLTVTLAVLLLIGCSVGATLAWLTAKTDTVTNTFTVGKVNITLQEHGYVEASNSLNTTKPVNRNTYKLIPGKNMPKDPFVTVASGSEKCWVFVCVKETNNTIDSDDEVAVSTDVISYSVNNGWNALQEDNGTRTYKSGVTVYYRVVDTAQMGTPLYIFEANGCDDTDHANGCVTVNPDLTSSYTATPTLTFTAAAIQYDGLEGNDETAAANAFNKLPDAFTTGILAPATDPET